ncbi:MAG: DUF3352 domain-containing protein [Puniceicoccales bacterium]|jgi:hypothetical protein|nr:DUF3352 domain-containing protein [Puniceicoccales bacterium]
MKISSIFRQGGVTLLSTLALVPFVDARHEKSLPADTFVAVQVADVPLAEKQGKEHPLWKDVQKAGLDAYFAPAIKKFTEKLKADGKGGDFQKNLELLQRELTGEVLFAVVKTAKTEKGHLPYDYVWIADTSADEKTIAGLVADSGLLPEEKNEISEWAYKVIKAHQEGGPPPEPPADDAADNSSKVPVVTKNGTTDFQGVTLYERQLSFGKDDPTSLGGWALVNKTFVYASAPNVLRELVDAVQNGRKDSFGTTALWKRSRDAAGKADALAVLNAPLAVTELGKYVAERAKAGASVGVNLPVAFNALALQNLEGLWLSRELTAEEVLIKGAWSYAEKRGLLSLITYKPLETTVPDFVPAGPYMFAIAKFDTQQAWKNLELLLAQAIPFWKMQIDGKLGELKDKENIDLRAAVFENIGDDITILTNADDNSGKTGAEALRTAGKLYVLELRDSDKFTSMVETAVGKIAPGGAAALFDERDFMGVKVRTVKDTGGASISYALYGKRLLVSAGAGSLLDKVIAELKDPRNPASKDPNVRLGLKKLPREVASFTYTDLGAYAYSLFDIIDAFAKARGEELTAPGSRPKADALPWAAASYVQERDREFYGETIIFRKEDK